MGASASVTPFEERRGVRGEDKYAVTTFRRVELQAEDLNILFNIYTKIKKKYPPPKVVDPQAICSYFGVSNSDFVLKLFAAVDFDGNDSIDFKEFTLGLWNFLSLASDFLAALVFYIYDPLKFNLLDMKELKELLEAVHSVKLSAYTTTLNGIMKYALESSKNSGMNTEQFGIMCIDYPFTIKPIINLQKQLRRKIVGEAYWKKLEFRRSASIRGNLRDVNYVYLVNEETEVWRKKDFELGIGQEYELTDTEKALIEVQEKKKRDREELAMKQKADREALEEKMAEEARIRGEEEAAQRDQEIDDILSASKEKERDMLSRGSGKSKALFNEEDGREVVLKKGIRKEFDSFSETMFMTGDGKFVEPDVPIEAVTVFEFPGDEKFIFGIVTDNKKKEEKVVMIHRDLMRRRVKSSDLSRINKTFKFVGYSKLSVKMLPEQIKIRPNEALLALCNDKRLIPPILVESEYTRGDWNEEVRSIVMKASNKGEANHLQNIEDLRNSKKNVVEEVVVETQNDRVNNRVSILINKQKKNRKSINLKSKRNTINNGGEKDMRKSIVATGAARGRNTINAGSNDSMPLKPIGGKLAPLNR